MEAERVCRDKRRELQLAEAEAQEWEQQSAGHALRTSKKSRSVKLGLPTSTLHTSRLSEFSLNIDATVFQMPKVTRPIETQRLVPPSNIHVQSTCDPSFAAPGYASDVQQRFDCYDTYPELFPASQAMNSTDPWNRLVQERSLPRPIMVWYGLIMHFCDSNHEITRNSKRKYNNIKGH